MSISTQITVAATAETIIITAPGALRGPMGDVTPEAQILVERAETAAAQSQSSAGQAASSAAQSGDSATQAGNSASSAAQSAAAASDSETAAGSSASSAQASASSATGSASAASSSASAAQASADEAQTSASAADQSATEAAQSAASAQEDADATAARVARFLAPSAVEPTQRDNGQPLQVGDQWPKTTDGKVYSWTGSAWVALDSGAQQLEERLAGPAGSGQIGWERGPVGLAQIKDVRGKLNTLEVSPWEFADLTTNRVNPLDPYTWNWSAAFQAMCNAHLRISVDGRYNLPTKVTLRPGAVLVGRGNMISAIKGPTSGPAFELLNPNGVTLVESPKFYDFTLECGTGSGIRLNSKTGGFTDNATTQSYMMRPVVDGVIFVGTITPGNFALDFNKCFNGVVIRSRLTGFDCAADFLGCDLNIIGGQPNRFMSNNIHTRIRSAGTFGSGTRLIGNDMLHAKVKAVESSDRDFSMGDNYFEQTAADPQLAELFDIEAGLHAHLYDNRVDCAAAQATSWLKVTGDFYSLSVRGNHTSGPTWGEAVFNDGAGSRYHASTINRQIITHSGNASEAGFPFNTVPADMNMPGRFKSAWHMYPGVDGLAAGGNPLARVVNNRFVLPYSSTNYYRFTRASEPLTGNVNVYIKASASTAGNLLVCQRRNGLAPIETLNQSLTTTPTWYQIFTNVAVNDLNMYFLNSADGQQDIYLHELVVDYA